MSNLIDDRRGIVEAFAEDASDTTGTRMLAAEVLRLDAETRRLRDIIGRAYKALKQIGVHELTTEAFESWIAARTILAEANP